MNAGTILSRVKVAHKRYLEWQDKADRVLAEVCADAYRWFEAVGYGSIADGAKDLATSLGVAEGTARDYLKMGDYLTHNRLETAGVSLPAVRAVVHAHGRLPQAATLKLLSMVRKGAKPREVNQVIREETYTAGRVSVEKGEGVTREYLRMEMMALLTVAETKYGRPVRVAILDDDGEIIEEVS